MKLTDAHDPSHRRPLMKPTKTRATDPWRAVMKQALWGLLLLPCITQAAGAWQASSAGPGMINRGMQAASPALTSPEPVSGVMTEVEWRYVLTGPAPGDLRVHLCAESRCVAIDGASGTTKGLTNVSASESLHFVYGIVGKGRLNQPLRVLSNEVMVNYR